MNKPLPKRPRNQAEQLTAQGCQARSGYWVFMAPSQYLARTLLKVDITHLSKRSYETACTGLEKGPNTNKTMKFNGPLTTVAD